MTMYPGPIVRTATKDDPNFDAKKDQVVINMHSGGEMVVERSEVGPDAPKAAVPKPAAAVKPPASFAGTVAMTEVPGKPAAPDKSK